MTTTHEINEEMVIEKLIYKMTRPKYTRGDSFFFLFLERG